MNYWRIIKDPSNDINMTMIDYDYSVIATSNDGGKTFKPVVNGKDWAVKEMVMDLMIKEEITQMGEEVNNDRFK